MSTPVEYNVASAPPYYLEREQDNVLTLGVYRDGALVAPSSAVFTLQFGSTKVVDARTATITGSQAQVTVTASDVASYSYSPGWFGVWALTMPDGHVHTIRKTASLCRVKLSCPATVGQLLTRFPDLNSYLPSGQSTWQPQLDKAWEEVQMWLEGQGRRPYLITDGYALLPLVEAMALDMIFELLAGSGDPSNSWQARAETWRSRAEHAKGAIKLEYDDTDSGSTSKKTGASATIWTNGYNVRYPSAKPRWA